VGGFLVVVRPARKQRVGPVLAAVVAPAGIAVAAATLAVRRLAVSATYTQFRGDFGTVPIGSSVLGKGVLTVGILLTVAVAWTVWSLRVAGES
jgi:hypothetical protein